MMLRVYCVLLLAACGLAPAADVPDLARALESGDTDARIAAAQRLAAASDGLDQVVPVLALAMRDAYYDVRMACTTAMARAGSAAIPALAAGLQHEHYYGPLYAARAAGLMGEEAAPLAPMLLDQLLSPDQDHRRWAAWALSRVGQVHGVDVQPALTALAERPTGWYGEDIARFLRNQHRSETAVRDAALAAALAGNRVAVEVFGQFGTDATAVVLEQVAGIDNRRQIWRYIELCRSLGPDAAAAVPWLQKELALDRDRWFVALQAETLGRIGPAAKPALPALLALLQHHEHGDVRLQAARAISAIAPTDVAVIAARKQAGSADADPRVRTACSD